MAPKPGDFAAEANKHIITTESSAGSKRAPSPSGVSPRHKTGLQPLRISRLFTGQNDATDGGKSDLLQVRKQRSALDNYLHKVEPHFSNVVAKKDKHLDDKKLLGMLDEFKQRKYTERKEHKGKDAHILDSLIHVLKYLDQTSRFKQLFLVENLRPMLIRPTHRQREYEEEFFRNFDLHKAEDEAFIFLYGCYLYDQQDYTFAMKAFAKLLEMGRCKNTGDQLSVLEYEARFNIAVCHFKMADCNKALHMFTELITD